MAIKKFCIELDNPNRSYFPGEYVTGRVVVISKSNKKIDLLTLKFFGKAQVSWSEKIVEKKGASSDTRESRKSVYFKNEQEYFNTEFSLLGTHFQRQSEEQRDFPFSFPLPLGLPSSYVGKAGQVYYYLEAKMQKSGMRNKTIDTKVLFTVNGIVDLNLDPTSNQGTQIRKYKSLCCFCCRSGPVGFALHLPRRGYVPGETLRFVVDISNQSNQKVKGIAVSLVQNVMFHAKGNSLEDTRVIRKVRGPTVSPGESEIWEGDIFQVPPIPPTRLGNCAIIDVQYLLKVEMQITGISTNLTGSTPITIGTIPLRTTFQELAARNSVVLNYADSGPSRIEFHAQVPSAPGFEGYPDLPPPSYAESMEGKPWVRLDEGIPNKSFSSAAISKRSTSSINKILDDQAEDDIPRDFVPNYVTYGWTAESGAAFRRDNVSE